MKKSVVPFLLMVLFFSACAKRTVTRVNPNEQIDLSGRWNDSDDRLVANDMISDVLSRRWITDFEKKHNKRPVVIVGSIKNSTAEHINTTAFVSAVEEELLNSGLVRIVQNSEFREKLRQERAAQSDFSSPETMKKFGRELGADFMLLGKISSVTDEYGKKKVIAYTVKLELDNLETNEKVWINNKTIKKYITD